MRLNNAIRKVTLANAMRDLKPFMPSAEEMRSVLDDWAVAYEPLSVDTVRTEMPSALNTSVVYFPVRYKKQMHYEGRPLLRADGQKYLESFANAVSDVLSIMESGEAHKHELWRTYKCPVPVQTWLKNLYAKLNAYDTAKKEVYNALARCYTANQVKERFPELYKYLPIAQETQDSAALTGELSTFNALLAGADESQHEKPQ